MTVDWFWFGMGALCGGAAFDFAWRRLAALDRRIHEQLLECAIRAGSTADKG